MAVEFWFGVRVWAVQLDRCMCWLRGFTVQGWVFSLGFWASRLTEFGLEGSGSNAEASDDEGVKSLELWFGI